MHQKSHEERMTNVPHPAATPSSEGGQIHQVTIDFKWLYYNQVTMWLINVSRQSTSSLIKPTFILSSSTCFFHVLFTHPFFLWHPTSNNNALKTWTSSSTHHHTKAHCLPWPTDILFYSNPTSASSHWLFLSLSCTPHIALTMKLSILS